MGRLGALILVLIISAGVFVGSQVFPFYYYYFEIQGLMEAQATKAQVFTDEQIRRELMQKIKKLDIPLEDESDLKINRAGGQIIIDLRYTEVLYVDFGGDRTYDLWEFDFNPHVERNF